jgi:hypothetical protein
LIVHDAPKVVIKGRAGRILFNVVLSYSKKRLGQKGFR